MVLLLHAGGMLGRSLLAELEKKLSGPCRMFHLNHYWV